MGESVVVLVIILLLGLTAGGLGCGSAQPGPKDTVRQMFDATEAGDWQKAASYTTTDSTEWLFVQQQGIVKSVDFHNLTLSVISESENEASVKAEYDIEITGAVFNEFTIRQHNSQTMKLVRVNGRWLISDVIQNDQ